MFLLGKPQCCSSDRRNPVSTQCKLAVAVELRGRGNPAWELGSLRWRGSSKDNEAKSSATAAFDGRHLNRKRKKGNKVVKFLVA